MIPRVVAPSPPDWRPARAARPKIAESAGAAFTSFEALASPDAAAGFTDGCVATPLPGWVEDMRPAVEGRTAALAGASAALVTGFPVDARLEGGVLQLRPASDLASSPIGAARTFVGFDPDGRVFTCFAVCAATRPGDHGTRACDRSVAEARLDGSVPPPSAGLALGAVTWAVHHPSETAYTAAGVVLLAGFLAVVLRRRPRTSIGQSV